MEPQALLKQEALEELLAVLNSLNTTPQVDGFTRKELQERMHTSKDRTLDMLHIADELGRLETVMVYRPILGSRRLTPRVGYRLKREKTK
jgi:hypothetical protein